MSPKAFNQQVAARVRAIMAEFFDTNNGAFAEFCQVNYGVVTNWRHAKNLPDEEAMAHLCDKLGVTMDWIYRGRVAPMDPHLVVKLDARIRADPSAPRSEPSAGNRKRPLSVTNGLRHSA
jgi:transcriptional regulator with XRE-family HTH domain